MEFKLESEYKPQGDQPQAIQSLVESLASGHRCQTLLGVTGSGKTYTMANVIQAAQRPAFKNGRPKPDETETTIQTTEAGSNPGLSVLGGES